MFCSIWQGTRTLVTCDHAKHVTGSHAVDGMLVIHCELHDIAAPVCWGLTVLKLISHSF